MINRLLLIVAIAFTIISCNSSKTVVSNSTVDGPLDRNYPWGSENPWGSLHLCINGDSVVDTMAMASRIIDKEKQKSKLVMHYRDDTTDIDNKLRIELSLILDLMVPQVPENQYDRNEFNPTYKVYTYVESRNGFKLNNYIPLTSSFNINRSERISSTGFKVSGDFRFTSVSMKTNDTVTVVGHFNRVGHGYIYSEIEMKYIESSKEN